MEREFKVKRRARPKTFANLILLIPVFLTGRLFVLSPNLENGLLFFVWVIFAGWITFPLVLKATAEYKITKIDDQLYFRAIHKDKAWPDHTVLMVLEDQIDFHLISKKKSIRLSKDLIPQELYSVLHEKANSSASAI